MKIHHAIVKAAAAKGVILSVNDDGFPTAHIPQSGVMVSLDDEGGEDQAAFNELAKTAWVNAQDITDYHAETANVRIRQDGTDFVAYHHADGEDGEEIARDPSLEDLMQSIQEALEDGVSDDTTDEDEAASGGVVPLKYKQRYAAEGHPDNCGDWLALTLNTLCHKLVGEKGKTAFDIEKMIAINDANGLETSKYTVNQSRGWEGRYRMTTRNMLAKVVAAAGVLYVPEGVIDGGDQELKAPADWCARFAPKPKAAASSKKPAKA